MFDKFKNKIGTMITETKEKADSTLDETKEKVSKLTESANKFLSDSNNQMKVITIVAIAVGTALVLSNITGVITSIYSVRHSKAPIIIQNIYPNKIGGTN